MMNNMMKLCRNVKRNRSASFPTNPTAAEPPAMDWGEIIFGRIVRRNRPPSFPPNPTPAEPTAMDCGEIILAVTPPEALAATVITGLTPMASADEYCSLQKSAFEEVSDPVRKTPSQPSMGEKKGKRAPV